VSMQAAATSNTLARFDQRACWIIDKLMGGSSWLTSVAPTNVGRQQTGQGPQARSASCHAFG
jgi:hypothetical protein